MKTLLKTYNPVRWMLFIAILFAVSGSTAQQIKPSKSGYAPVNGIKVYYEVYGEAPMPKSQLAIVPSQGHVSLMTQSTTILDYMNSFLK